MAKTLETKPGYKTTEFWGTAAFVVGSVIAAIADKLPSRYAEIAGAIAVGLYTLSRGQAKKGMPYSE